MTPLTVGEVPVRKNDSIPCIRRPFPVAYPSMYSSSPNCSSMSSIMSSAMSPYRSTIWAFDRFLSRSSLDIMSLSW